MTVIFDFHCPDPDCRLKTRHEPREQGMDSFPPTQALRTDPAFDVVTLVSHSNHS